MSSWVLIVLTFVGGALAVIVCFGAVLCYLVIRRAFHEVHAMREDSARAARLFKENLRASVPPLSVSPHDRPRTSGLDRADR